MCRASGHVFPPCLQLGLSNQAPCPYNMASSAQQPDPGDVRHSFQAFASGTPRSLVNRVAGCNNCRIIPRLSDSGVGFLPPDPVGGVGVWHSQLVPRAYTGGTSRFSRCRVFGPGCTYPLDYRPPILTAVAQSTWGLAITRSRS